MSKVDVFDLGAQGVNIVVSPIHRKAGTLEQAQNVQKTLASEGGGIAKRAGQDLLADVGTGPVMAIINVALVPPPLLDPDSGVEVGQGDPMRCRAYKTAHQAIADNTLTVASFDVEDFDVGNLHDNVTDNTRFTCPADGAGVYLVIAQSSWEGRNATGGRVGVFIYKNGTQRLFMQEETPDAASGDDNLGTSIQCSGLVVMVPGDYIEMKVQQDSGGALDLLGITNDLTSLTIARLFVSA